MKFATRKIVGMDGAVRGFFQARNLDSPASADVFPGVSQVAILPRRFKVCGEAASWLEGVAEPGGNAVAVQIAPQEWLVGAWIED